MPFLTRSRLVAASVLLLSGCSKSLTHTGADISTRPSAEASSIFTTDPTLSPSYGDSILFVQNTGRSAYLFRPVNTLGKGTFVSWPKGLTIDPVTGEIDVLRSEPGARYNVGFISSMTGDTAYRQIILAGITYPDGIYDLSTANTSIQPYFNADASAPAVANSVFDELGIANGQNLVVNTQTGAIDLKASIAQGLFGGQPNNGDSREISIYYRLNDQSHMNLLRTNVIVYYYNTLSDVPRDKVDACLLSRMAFQQTKSHPDLTEVTSSKGVTSNGGKTPPTTPRPPQVIIVNAGHH